MCTPDCHRRTFLYLLAGASLSAAFAPLGGSAIAAPESDESARLVGIHWRLENVCGERVLDNVEASLSFPTASKVIGNGSCNSFSGQVEIKGNSITFGRLASTLMACADAISDQESKYLSTLGNARRFQMKDHLLLIYVKGEDKPLRFHQN